MVPEIFVERLAARGFDGAADPVGVDPVLPLVARIKQQRQPQRSELAGAGRGRMGGGDVADQLAVQHLVAKARGMGQQVAQGDRAGRRPQPRLSRRVEPLQHVGSRQLRQDTADRLVERELALLDQLHRRDRGHRLGHRGDAKDRVLGHRRAGGKVAPPERALVNDAAVGRRQGYDAGHVAGLDGAPQHRVDIGARCHQCRLLKAWRNDRRKPKAATVVPLCVLQTRPGSTLGQALWRPSYPMRQSYS